MEGKNSDSRIRYQAKPHHCEILRKQINNSKMVDRLEINQNPSIVSRKAYNYLYKDELSKQLQQHQNKRQWERKIDSDANYSNKKQSRSNSLFERHNNNTRKDFLDFDKQKTMKVQSHIHQNYDGGKGFYKASEEWDKTQKKRAEQVKLTLQMQIQNKNYALQQNKNMKNLQIQTFNRKVDMDNTSFMKQKTMEIKAKENNRNFILGQIEDEKVRKKKLSLFEYNNQTRHNPITNPIEYHIDNPYILKKLQDTNIPLKLQ